MHSESSICQVSSSGSSVVHLSRRSGVLGKILEAPAFEIVDAVLRSRDALPSVFGGDGFSFAALAALAASSRRMEAFVGVGRHVEGNGAVYCVSMALPWTS